MLASPRLCEYDAGRAVLLGHDNRIVAVSASTSTVQFKSPQRHPMPRKPKSGKTCSRGRREAEAAGRDPDVRIIGGQFRGRRLRYHGDPVVRPMKHRTREAIFNLVTTDAVGRHVIDLFAGTGALGLEALSRGAASATFIEKHVPSARVIEENIRTLDVADRSNLHGDECVPVGKARFIEFGEFVAAGGPSVAGVLQSPICVLRRASRGDVGAHSTVFNKTRPRAACSSLRRMRGSILKC